MSQLSDEESRKIREPTGKSSVKDAGRLAAVLAHLNEMSFSRLRKISGKRPYIAAVIAAQNRAGRELPNVTTSYPGKLPKGAEGTHYSAEGCITLGKFTASAVERFYKAK
jgi:hypothetical protein